MASDPTRTVAEAAAAHVRDAPYDPFDVLNGDGPRWGTSDHHGRTGDARTTDAPPEDESEATGEAAPNPLLQRMVTATLTTEELKARKPAPMLIEGFLALDSTAVLFGPSGGNKTFIALDMVLHVTTGSWWWGQETRTGRVVYVLAEGAGRFGKRIDAWQRHHGVRDLDNYEPVTWLTRAVNLHAPESVAAFIEYLGDDPPALIVFDTLARNIVGVEENSARDMGQVIDHLDLIRRHTGACVLLVHHSGLAGGRARGSTALFGSIDTELEVVPDEDRATLKVTKQKDGAEANPRHFERINVGDSCVMAPVTRDREHLPAGARSTLDALASVAVEGGVSTTVWRSATDIAERTFYNHRAGLLQAGLVQNVGGSRQPLYVVVEVQSDEG